jgi:hypothetical protein
MVGVIFHIDFHDVFAGQLLDVLAENGNATKSLFEHLIMLTRSIDFDGALIVAVSLGSEYHCLNIIENDSAQSIC